MKRFVCILLCVCGCLISLAQSFDDSDNHLPYSSGAIVTPRYKLYQTENMYNLIRLDTATGALWMVQYGIKDVEDGIFVLDDTSLLFSGEEEIAGRFELYPTKNMYNFILLDTLYGNTYQVQWHTDLECRFRRKIYPAVQKLSSGNNNETENRRFEDFY